MTQLTGVQKLPRQAGLEFGVSTAYPLLARGYEAGLVVGEAEFRPGEVELDLTYDEGVFILEGQLDIEADGATHHAEAGEFLWLPRGRKLVYRVKASCRFLYMIPGAPPPARDSD